MPSVDVGNVLNEAKKQQVIALGRLGWSLRRIQKNTGEKCRPRQEHVLVQREMESWRAPLVSIAPTPSDHFAAPERERQTPEMSNSAAVGLNPALNSDAR